MSEDQVSPAQQDPSDHSGEVGHAGEVASRSVTVTAAQQATHHSTPFIRSPLHASPRPSIPLLAPSFPHVTALALPVSTPRPHVASSCSSYHPVPSPPRVAHHGGSSPLAVLREEMPRIVRSLNRQLKEKSLKTRVGVFSVLKELVHVLPSCLRELIALLIPGIQKALSDKASNSNLKIEALLFTRLAMASHPPHVFQPHIKVLLSPPSHT
ncbi:unnamed protein product, partial [Closterium sp. NIES-53]